MDDLFGIIMKVQTSHNQLGSFYLQLARSLIKLQEIHDSQLVKIEELELQAIQSKVKIEVFKRNELEKTEILTESSKPQQKIKTSSESTILTPKRNQEIPHIFPGTFQTIQKKRPDSSVKSKIVKTQSNLHSFIQKKTITEKSEKTSQVRDPRIIIDDDGFHLLDYKKTR
jgi:hypothetical protein